MKKLFAGSLASILVMCATFAMAQQQAATLTDAQIAEILDVANAGEIKTGKEAKSSASNSEVKQFAEQMITDHKAMSKSNKELAKKLDIKPKESDTSKTLEADAKTTLKELKKLKGPEFDKAYIASQVSMHQTVLDTINNMLLPNAKNPELKTMLTQAAPQIEAHLKHAKDMQSKMR
ncbi:MAG TPA: DUF4142 domain-containing protein [Methylophilaceae bacterium]|nr:DUF4142 domain-containing protein [Methylophilaceae bacterium]